MSAIGYDPYELEDINLDHEERIQEESREPMTTVVGIKSNYGIVLTSDNQWTSNVKNFSSKLYEINKWVGFGASGSKSYIRHLVKKLEDLRLDDLVNEEKFRDRVDGLLAPTL
jgi:20S proteasome alpha/beta subunit